MNKIGVPKMNNRTGNMEQKFITESGKTGKIIFSTCPYINCNFHTNFEDKNTAQTIKKHCEENHE